jgi:flagellar motility protein MotE (MotC chaperone)
MTRTLEIAFMALGSLALFAVAFVGFAAKQGAPLGDLPVVGDLLASEEVAEEDDPEIDLVAEVDRKTDRQIVQAGVGLLAAYRLPLPFSGEELGRLAGELKARKNELDRRAFALDGRELRIAEREEIQAAQFEALDEMRADLERIELELEQRAAEVARDVSATKERNEASAQTRATLFAEGEPEELVGRLTKFGADDAADILVSLGPERATELLNALPETAWLEYANAYTSAQQP